MLRLGLREDAADQPETEREDKDRTEIDRQIVEPRRRRRPDPAEKSPAGAIDREAEPVDQPRMA